MPALADWAEEETEAAGGSGTTQHLWEESWDDDDTSDDFSAQLKCVLARRHCKAESLTCGREELKKVEASKKR